ncbi:MAG TPA: hypothetical protein VJ757_00630, partial [Pseudonocardiaceae bacterium]|nr:hypothetical protein [Pseudonocardiaceae bacterium]
MKRHGGIGTQRVVILFTMLVAVLGAVVSCGGSTGGRAGSSGGGAVTSGNPPDTIMINNFAYQPVVLTVAPGARVTVINQDSVAHTVTAKDKSFDTGTVALGREDEITAPS